ncbi:hypothetical protein Tco_0688457 [Tanacetum coccineum]
MACDVSWKSRMTKWSDENMLLKSQVELVVQERENIKLEFQKQFNSIKATRVQHQHELIEHANQKIYTYADVRAKNQDLLITITELKAKLAAQAKNVNTKSDSKDTNSKKRVLLNTKAKRTSKDVKKSQSSFTSVANKNDTMNSNVSDSKTNLLKAKTINSIHDGLNRDGQPEHYYGGIHWLEEEKAPKYGKVFNWQTAKGQEQRLAAVDGDEGDEMMVRWRLWRRWSPWWQRRGGDGGATVVNMAEVMVAVVWR